MRAGRSAFNTEALPPYLSKAEICESSYGGKVLVLVAYAPFDSGWLYSPSVSSSFPAVTVGAVTEEDSSEYGVYSTQEICFKIGRFTV